MQYKRCGCQWLKIAREQLNKKKEGKNIYTQPYIVGIKSITGGLA